MNVLPLDPEYVLNHCARSLARTSREPRHDFGQYASESVGARICEAWRFPLIDGYYDETDPVDSYALNRVTFVYMSGLGHSEGSPPPDDVAVIGTFATLHDPIPLERVRFEGEDTAYFALTVTVPKGEVHTYKFLVDGRPELDPVNPQRERLDNGRLWSRFFTQRCTRLLALEPHEAVILERLTSHILPFRTPEAQRFVDIYYYTLDRRARESQLAHAYRLDQEVGAVNYIDKVLAREEAHHLRDYRECLDEIDRWLRTRNPYIEPAQMTRDTYVELYQFMEEDAVPGWDYGRYASPRYFLQLLRRHTLTGAFSHPKYGGNSAAAGWAYLEERFRATNGDTLFDWRRAIEPPLGKSLEYRG